MYRIVTLSEAVRTEGGKKGQSEPFRVIVCEDSSQGVQLLEIVGRKDISGVERAS